MKKVGIRNIQEIGVPIDITGDYTSFKPLLGMLQIMFSIRPAAISIQILL